MKALKYLFFILIFLIPFEIYTVSLGDFVRIRPYQIVTLILILLLAYQYLAKKITLSNLTRPFRSPVSKLLAAYFIVSVISLANTPNLKGGIQETLVLLSFLVVYWLVMYFVKTSWDAKLVLYAFLASGLVAAVVALAQVVAFKAGLGLIEVMPGRPNSILPEPDWLGFFMVFVLAISISVKHIIKPDQENQSTLLYLCHNKYSNTIVSILFYLTLILAIARASWLAAIGIIAFYLFLIFIDKSNPFSLAFTRGLYVALLILISLGIIQVFNLTPFPLQNRFLSIITRQEIHAVVTDPETGKEISIEKNKINEYKNKGVEVREQKVKDINIVKRTESFTNMYDIVLRHPILGIGFGGLQEVFGQGTNANNIFFEIWVASGVVGLVLFALVFYCIFREWLFFYLKKRNAQNQAYLFFIILGLIAILIPNVFNSGLLLGFFWVYLGLAANLLDNQLYGVSTK